MVGMPVMSLTLYQPTTASTIELTDTVFFFIQIICFYKTDVIIGYYAIHLVFHKWVFYQSCWHSKKNMKNFCRMREPSQVQNNFITFIHLKFSKFLIGKECHSIKRFIEESFFFFEETEVWNFIDNILLNGICQ